ncbi:MAG: hypothetical protein ACOYVF_13890 [Candidatus Zixiibacteriota bacterium]
MQKKIVNVILITLAVMLALGITAFAQAPNTIVYQGRLTDDVGDPITTATTVTFSIYEDSNDVIPVDTFIRTVTFTGNGVFTTELGPFTTAILDGTETWLGIKVGADPEMGDRQLITSVPYAFSSAYAETVPDNSITTTKIATGAVGGSDLAANSVTTDKITNYTIIGSDVASSTLTGANIENSSLYAADLAQEPGLARTYTASKFISPDSSIVFVDSLSINVPSAGYLLVQSNSYASITGTIIGNIRASIDTVKQASFPTTELVVVGSSAEVIDFSETRWYSCTVTRCFYINTARTINVYLNADRGYDDGTAYLYYNKMYALYIPTAYGTVSYGSATPGAAGDIPQTTGDMTAPGEITPPTYEADLPIPEVDVEAVNENQE